MEIKVQDPVICSYCGKPYQEDSQRVGGVIFQHQVIGPCCSAQYILKLIDREQYFDAFFPRYNEPFYQFVCRIKEKEKI